MLKLPTVVGEHEIIKRHGKVVKDVFFLDADGKTRDFLQWGGARDGVMVFAVTPEKMVLAIPQFRRGAQEVLLEPAGGSVEDDEFVKEAASRELLTESGYKAGKLIYLGKQWIDPPSCFTPMHSFLALDCVKAAEQNLEETEKMEMGEPVLTSLPKWIKMIHSGQIHDFKTIAITFLALPYLC